MSSVSLKNTKQELLTAYEALERETKRESETSPKVPTTALKTSSGHFQKAIETLVAIKSPIDDAIAALEQQRERQSHDETEATARLEQFSADMRRAKEELDYDLKRWKQEKLDELETELSGKRKVHEDRIVIEQKSLEERQEALEKEEIDLRDLRKRVELFPKELEKSVQDAVDIARAEEQGKARVARDLLEKQVDGERAIAKLKIENLEKTVKEQADEVRALKSQLEQATRQVKDIAVSVIDSRRPVVESKTPPQV